MEQMNWIYCFFLMSCIPFWYKTYLPGLCNCLGYKECEIIAQLNKNRKNLSLIFTLKLKNAITFTWNLHQYVSMCGNLTHPLVHLKGLYGMKRMLSILRKIQKKIPLYYLLVMSKILINQKLYNDLSPNFHFLSLMLNKIQQYKLSIKHLL